MSIPITTLVYCRGSFRKHEQIKHEILTDPSLVGIDRQSVVSVETEVPIRKRRKSVVAQPDLAIRHVGRRGIVTTFIEVKSGNCRLAQRSLQSQLRKVSKVVRRHRMCANVIGVYPEGSALHIVFP